VQHRGRQGRVGRVQRDKRREGFQRDRHRKILGRVLDQSDRVFAAKPHVGEAFAIQHADKGLAAGLNAQGKILLDRRRAFGEHLVVLGPKAAVVVLVEDVPVDQAPVAGEVDLPGADPAHRHADHLQVVAAVEGALVAGAERGDPFRVELLVGRDEVVDGVFRLEGAGDARQTAGHRQRRGPGACPPDECPAVHASAAAVRGAGIVFL
jgi:hypothetical protein